MRTKNFSIRFVCLVLVLCICVPLVACKKEDPSTDTNNNGDDNKKVVTTAKNSELIAYGNYFFFMSKKISRYNSKTGELTKACRDIECDGKKCPLECVYSTIAGVYDDKLYFFAYQNWKLNDKIFIGYQDILTGEVTALKTIDADLISMGSDQIYVDGGYVYYEATSLKEGGDKKNPNDYERTVWRISLDGKKDEAFLKFAENEGMAIVCDGKLIMGSEGKLYSIDIETKEKSLLFDCETYDTVQITGLLVYENGKLYFTALSKYPYVPEITGGEVPLELLYSADINTGEVKKVIEEPVRSFTVTNDAIYYVPFKYRVLYMPDDYENNKDDLKTWGSDYTIYACDHDGKNIRAVYSNEKLNFLDRMVVIDGVLYTSCADYIEEEHTYSSTYSFRAIDLETGVITKPKMSE